jgi:hypothetical protein
MRRQFLRIVIALIGVAGFGLGANAQSLDQIEFNTPHEFVVGGKTFPAGTYRVRRESSNADKNDVRFVQVGDEHFLNKIETPNHSFTIEVSRAEILDAVAKSQSGSSASGSAGGNK